MKMAKVIVAAAITAATLLCSGGVQVTRSYIDQLQENLASNVNDMVDNRLNERGTTARFDSLENHEVAVNAVLTNLIIRLTALEAFHPVEPDEPEPEPEPAYYVYTVKRNGANFGTLTVDVRSPSRVSAEWNDTYFYEYAYTRSWSGSPTITLVRKGFPKAGYTWQPWCWIEFQNSAAYQIQSRNTGSDQHSFYTGSEQFTYGGYTYTVALDHIETE